ncbi:MAG TPA: L,D-transpeptidase [Steroidobacteraceae bacterium]|nr:L,D-transpeptidase [Steroidobacteraceae bacterium]
MSQRSILIRKGARRLFIYDAGHLEREYPVALGRNGSCDKRIEGDEATPLGEFYVCAKNPLSKFHRSVCLSYPNLEDAERGLADHLISPQEHAAILAALRERRMPPQHTRLGGEIYIHGQPLEPDGRAVTMKDWTRGCIALDNADMQELYDRVDLGTPVRIVE